MNPTHNKQSSEKDGTQKSVHPLDRYTKPATPAGGNEDKSPFYKSQAPTIDLPKGGGALKSIDEKFTVNAVNGTSSLQVPLPLTPGRSGFTPSLSLQYNSGSGNSEFGLGWGLSLPSIQRKTDKKLPEYNDAAESDVFLLAGAEDLIPFLASDGPNWVSGDFTIGDFTIRKYRPRIEGLFARIEHIKKAGVAGSWWRATTKDNIVTYYGLTANGRIADPENESCIYKWLPQLVLDNKGNVQEYEYSAENLDNVPVAVHERNRHNESERFANRYLKNVKYCNLQPYTVTETDIYQPVLPLEVEVESEIVPVSFLMQVVFDYGDHDNSNPPLEPAGTWHCRKDPFSDFHAGFEIRTYRRCYRVLMFHSFPELTIGTGLEAVLVKSLDITYINGNTTADNSTFAEADMPAAVTLKGYKYSGGTYQSRSMPSFTFGYNPLDWDTEIHNVSPRDTENAPQGLTGPYQWIDLWGEGLPGILTEQGTGWFYKSNKGDGKFTPALSVAPKPSLVGLGSTLQWQDLDADGRRQVVSQDTLYPGYYELGDDQQWQSFHAFKDRMNVDWNSPYTKMLDLDGDGRPDLLMTSDTVWTWYKNKGTEGYTTGGRNHTWHDEEQGPRLVLNDSVQTIFLADMNGDGMTDIVRIKNGEVCYWPNKGYGRFGRKVTMSNSPVFDNPEQFNPIYITLSDISGTGAPDIIYLGNNRCTAWINFAGNAFSQAYEINPLPGVDPFSKIAVLDFLGNGTGCIVWSSPLPQHAHAPMRYIDLMGGNKPFLMNSYSNGLGKTVSFIYKSSTKFYLEDKEADTPWATRLPFPVQCVSQVVTSDTVSETTYTQSYTYHHGYYDHEEREFRGFGRVETLDTDVAVVDDSNDLDQPPVYTKTWYHTGAWLKEGTLLDAFSEEYYTAAGWWDAPHHAEFATGLNTQEMREAHRALKGLPLRQEVYAKDGTEKEPLPYTVSSYAYCVKSVQPLIDNRHASFYSYQQQNVVWHCEREVSAPPHIA